MIFIHGKRKVRIKRHFDNIEQCLNCNSLKLKFDIFRTYYHLFWIPIFPFGEKETRISCNNCGAGNGSMKRIKHFELITRTPIYLFSGIILFAGLLITLIIGNINTQKEKARFIEEPMIGDIYKIRKKTEENTYYYFLRVTEVDKDFVKVNPNKFEYLRFVSTLSEDDSFVNEEIIFTKTELKNLLESGEINSVDRNINHNN